MPIVGTQGGIPYITSRLSFGEHEADAANGVNQLDGSFRVDLLAQACHVDVDDVVDRGRRAGFLPDLSGAAGASAHGNGTRCTRRRSPEKDPYALKPGESLPVRVLLRGRPEADVLMKAASTTPSGKATGRR